MELFKCNVLMFVFDSSTLEIKIIILIRTYANTIQLTLYFQELDILAVILEQTFSDLVYVCYALSLKRSFIGVKILSHIHV